MGCLDEAAAIRRLHDRFGLGASAAELDASRSRGFDASLQALLTPAPADAGVAATPAPTFPTLPFLDAGDPRRETVEAERAAQQRELRLWWLDRMAAARQAGTERMTWFWHGHFATSDEKVTRPSLMLAQNETMRRLGLGDFRTLAHAMVTDPAMIMWLDNDTNVVRAPNENLGRELLELFALGVGSYSETDVREAARALTGWTVGPDAATATFVPARHDAGPTTVLGSRAARDARTLVDTVVATAQSARFVATRLWTRFVRPDPPAGRDLERLVDAYGPGADLTALLRALATAPAFQETSSSMVKSPVEWAVSFARAVGARPGALDGTTRRDVHDALGQMGQLPFRPPNVGGWPSGQAWLAPAATTHRLDVAWALLEVAPPLTDVPDGSAARADWAARVLAVERWTDRTRDALTGLGDGDPRLLLAAAAVAPEYVVSG